MFTGNLSWLVTRERQRQLQEAARARRATSSRETPVTRVTLRFAAEADRSRLRELAMLDSAEPLHGTVLLAEVDGRLRAALDLDRGSAIADPFFRGAELVDLLRLRAAQLA